MRNQAAVEVNAISRRQNDPLRSTGEAFSMPFTAP